MFVGQFERRLRDETMQRLFSQHIGTFLTNKPFFTSTSSKKEIENNTYYRQKEQHDHPRHRLYRITIIQNQHYHKPRNHNQIQKNENNRYDMIQ